MNLVFFGMSGPLARLALDALIHAGHTPCAFVTPAPAAGPVVSLPARDGPSPKNGRRPLPTLTPLQPMGLATVATERGIPLLEVRSARSHRTVEAVRAFQPDVIAVACFPWKLPEALLATPRLGSLNVHPSLLPENRGPDPLFWTFRRGDSRTGATVHLMTEELDAGPILSQEEIPVENGMSEAMLERRCAEAGGRLLVEAISGLAGGSLTPMPQDERRATYYPQPGPLDYLIEPDWPARRCENFTRGVIGRGQPILVRAAGATYRVVEPLGVMDETPGSGDLPDLADGVLTLRRPVGTWRVRVAPL